MIGAIKGSSDICGGFAGAAGIARRYISALSSFDIPAQMNRVFTAMKTPLEGKAIRACGKFRRRRDVINR